MPYWMPPIISLREINSIYGVQGSGKTTFVAQLIKSSLDNEPFFGYRLAEPLKGKNPIAYCAYDRSTAKSGELLAKFGLDKRIPWRSFRNIDSMDSKEPYPLEDLPTKYFPDSKLIVVDGSGLLIPKGKGNDYGHTGSFYRYAGAVAEKNDITFIFLQHCPKDRGIGNSIINARQAQIGSTVTGAMTEGGIFIEFVDPANLEDPRRKINFIPHDDKTRKIMVQFNNQGILVEIDMDNLFIKKSQWYDALSEVFTKQNALELGESYQIAESTVEKYLTTYVKDGKLQRTDQGLYRKLSITLSYSGKS